MTEFCNKLYSNTLEISPCGRNDSSLSFQKVRLRGERGQGGGGFAAPSLPSFASQSHSHTSDNRGHFDQREKSKNNVFSLLPSATPHLALRNNNDGVIPIRQPTERNL